MAPWACENPSLFLFILLSRAVRIVTRMTSPGWRGRGWRYRSAPSGLPARSYQVLVDDQPRDWRCFNVLDEDRRDDFLALYLRQRLGDLDPGLAVDRGHEPRRRGLLGGKDPGAANAERHCRDHRLARSAHRVLPSGGCPAGPGVAILPQGERGLGGWGAGDLGIWGAGGLGIWGSGDLGIWGSGDLGIWGSGDLGIWGSGRGQT